ncbi:hypothetical protein BS78_02G109400 [Paspalum vaginatum]|nr:hypothetical protein BS78_02G109400 [Paspalum vaginatum]
MDRRRGSKSKKTRTAAVGPIGDRITTLPLELRARIVSVLSFREIVRLTALSRAWRHIHHHTPVVEINLLELYWDEDLADEDSALCTRVALSRRAQDASAPKVESLSLTYVIDDRLVADRRMRRHADRIIALANAHDIRIQAAHSERFVQDAWTLDLSPAARHLAVTASRHLAPAIMGPGAAALRKLRLFSRSRSMVLREWPHLPSLRSLGLNGVIVEAPFAPGSWCPLLEELDMFNCEIEQARVDVRLPWLRFLDMDAVDVRPRGKHCRDGEPFGVITIDVPMLLNFEMYIDAAGSTTDYKSFTMRAPGLRLLCWRNQFAERVVIDVGKPGSVKLGAIRLTTIYYREMEQYREQMMRMLQGLLPDLPPESVADVARPYLEECTDSEDEDDDGLKDKRLTCDLEALMSRDV